MKSTLALLVFFSVLLLLSCGEAKQNTSTTKTEKEVKIPALPIHNDGVAISYNSYGQGEPTLLFVHGWGINQSYWSQQVEALQTDYRIVTIDLPGFGESGKNRTEWSIEKYASDIDAVIEQLTLDRVILVGHSMGGDVVLESALQNEKVIALIGVDNFKEVGVEINKEVQEEINGFMDLLKSNYSQIAAAYADGALFHPSTDSLVRRRVISDISSSDSTIAIASLESLFAYALIETEQLAKLKQPLYLINSDATPTNREGLDATNITYEVIAIPATGHYPMIEKPDQFNALLRQTMQQIQAAHSLN